jgi:hypothetical protein
MEINKPIIIVVDIYHYGDSVFNLNQKHSTSMLE